jgi:hypothetical protein
VFGGKEAGLRWCIVTNRVDEGCETISCLQCVNWGGVMCCAKGTSVVGGASMREAGGVSSDGVGGV